jgi:hypothetical protein
MDRTPNDFLDGVPVAHSVRVFFCLNPKCKRPHVVLLKESGTPLAHFVLPDPLPGGGGFLHDLQDAAYRSAVERNG